MQPACTLLHLVRRQRRLGSLLLLALFALVFGSHPAPPQASAQSEIKIFLPMLSRPLRVMPLGDSITLGVNGGYRVGIWQQAEADGLLINFVGSAYDEWGRLPDKDHEGHPGFTVGDLLREIDGWMASAKPDVVLLMAGTNDLAWWHIEGVSTTAARLGTLIDRIKSRAPNARIIVGSIGPMKGLNAQGASRDTLADAYNLLVAQEVARRAALGMDISFVDVNAALTTADLYDDVHPGEDGHAKIARVWYAALAPVTNR